MNSFTRAPPFEWASTLHIYVARVGPGGLLKAGWCVGVARCRELGDVTVVCAGVGVCSILASWVAYAAYRTAEQSKAAASVHMYQTKTSALTANGFQAHFRHMYASYGWGMCVWRGRGSALPALAYGHAAFFWVKHGYGVTTLLRIDGGWSPCQPHHKQRAQSRKRLGVAAEKVLPPLKMCGNSRAGGGPLLETGRTCLPVCGSAKTEVWVSGWGAMCAAQQHARKREGARCMGTKVEGGSGSIHPFRRRSGRQGPRLSVVNQCVW